MRTIRGSIPTTGGSGPTVTSTYLDSFELSVDAGFVCQPSGTKYRCGSADLDRLQHIIFNSEKLGVLNNILIYDWYNEKVLKDLDTLKSDFAQLTLNLKQLWEYTGYVR